MGPQQDRTAPKAHTNGTAAPPVEGRKDGKVVHYKECQRNHAAGIGGYAVNGCREFMASGADGTAGALVPSALCAACGCHRSFHKREVEPDCDCSSDTSGR